MSDTPSPVVTWVFSDGYWETPGRNLTITIEPRPHYCDRGAFIAKLHLQPMFPAFDLDAADGWPRYYFDLGRAKAECEAWLKKRGQI